MLRGGMLFIYLVAENARFLLCQDIGNLRAPRRTYLLMANKDPTYKKLHFKEENVWNQYWLLFLNFFDAKEDFLCKKLHNFFCKKGSCCQVLKKQRGRFIGHVIPPAILKRTSWKHLKLISKNRECNYFFYLMNPSWLLQPLFIQQDMEHFILYSMHDFLA